MTLINHPTGGFFTVGPCLLWVPPPLKQSKQCSRILNKDLAGSLGDLSIALVLPLLSLVLPWVATT